MNKVFKALSDPTRRKVLQLLRKRPMTAGDLADQFDLAKPTMSAHFNTLKEADLIYAEKEGTTITYRLRMSVLQDALFGFVETFGIDVAEVGTADVGKGSEGSADARARTSAGLTEQQG